MARSRIPYTDLEEKLKEMFQAPSFVNVELKRPTRQNDISAPTTLYDRSTGNYRRWGYMCDIRYAIFMGFSSSWTGRIEADYIYVDTKMPIQHSG